MRLRNCFSLVKSSIFLFQKILLLILIFGLVFSFSGIIHASIFYYTVDVHVQGASTSNRSNDYFTIRILPDGSAYVSTARADRNTGSTNVTCQVSTSDPHRSYLGGTTSHHVRPHAYGATVDNNSIDDSEIDHNILRWSPSEVVGSETRSGTNDYIGFRVHPNNEIVSRDDAPNHDWHYGWVRFSWSVTYDEDAGSDGMFTNAEITFHEWAINQTLNESIVVGSTASGQQMPTLTTENASVITDTTATGHGNITSLGGLPITQHGHCWATSPLPTTANSTTTLGGTSSTGAFTSNITGLSPGTTYYVRAYATNSEGTSYGNQISFTTVSAAPFALEANDITPTSFTANWNSSTGATGYRLDVSTNDDFSSFVAGYENRDVGDDTTFNVTGLTPETTYYYRVRAENASGVSDNSNTITTNTASFFAGGTGTSGDPFQIETWEHLNNVRNYLGADYSDSHFKLMNNLDSQTVGYDIHASDTANSDSGWLPIGSGSGASAFHGTFDGNSKTIGGLYINRPATNHVGLYGYIQSATIKNVGVIDVDYTGRSSVGALVGVNFGGTIINSYTTGNISGNEVTGGLTGANYGTIKNSFSNCNVFGVFGVGGLVGANSFEHLMGTIINSYAFGNVTGTTNIGGLSGIGGGTVENSYAIGKVTGSTNVGGLIGVFEGTVENSFWDIYSTGQSTSAGGLGLATINMITQDVFSDSGWNFTDTWTILPNRSYPYLKWQSSDTPFATAYSIDSEVLPSSDSGSVTISADTQFAGGTVTITANANPGYELYSWTISPDSGIIANTSSATTEYTIADTNVTITANFIIERIFAGGDGSEGDPYQISTWKHLNNIRDYLGSDHTNTHFILNNNLDPGTDGYDDYASSAANGGEGWEPIGFDQDANAFHGTFDGDSFTISGLYINRPDSDFVGLFGYIRNSMIKNVGVINIDCTGKDRVGGLVGRNWEGIIKNSYATGSVTGNSNVGGLVGHNYMSNAIIIESYANVNVTGNDNVGGLVGVINWSAIVKNSYAMGNVHGDGNNAGGLVGSNSDDGEIRKSYAVGKVSGNNNVGGLVGNNNSGTVEHSFFDIHTTGRPFEDVGDGLDTIKMVDSGVFTDAGWNFADTWTILPNQSYPFFKWQTSDIPFATAYSIDSTISPAGAGQITISADTLFLGGTVAISAFANMGYEFDSWTVSPGVSGNRNDSVTIFTIYDTNAIITANFIGDFAGGDGSEGNPFHITTWEHLNNIRKYLGDTYTNTHFKLTENLDSNIPDYDDFASDTANAGAGWEPIGWKDGAMDNNNPFFGTFDGDSKTISGLYINRPDSDYVGLFGYIQNSMIKNVGVIDINYIGNNFVGGLVGFNHSGTIKNSYATGNVNGSGSGMVVGGLTGTNQGTIKNSYANVNSNGNTDIGGLVGQLTAAAGTIKNSYARGNANGNARIGGLVGGRSNGTIINSYAVGKVSGNNDVGGLVGWANSTEFITNSFWDIYTTGQSESAGGSGDLGLATINMITQDVFADSGWNFTDTWSIIPNQSYPFLKWQTSDTPFATTTYSIDSAINIPASGSVLISADTQFAGGTVAITATAAGGYLFDSWTVTPDSGTFANSNDSVTIYTFADTNVTVTANFIELDFFGGDGSTGNPFQITTWRHLNNVRNYLGADYSDSHFKLMNNLDSTTVGYDIYASDTANSDSGWLPIGSGSGAAAFQGTFDGDSYTIGNVYINRPLTDNVGLFGVIQNSMIKNIGVININCTGVESVGGLVGLVNSGTIINSYAVGKVTAGVCVGGLVGVNNSGIIKNSYASGQVNGNNEIGGFVGWNSGIIKNSYTSSQVNGNSWIGGLVGGSGGTITNSYAIGKTTGSSDVGGLVGGVGGTVQNSFWDIYTTGQSTSAGGLGLATINMITQDVFSDSGWNFTDTWSIIPNQSYPFLSWQISDTPFATAYSIDSAVSIAGAGEILISADTQFAGGTVSISVIEMPGYGFDSWTVSPYSGIFDDTNDSVTIYTFADTNVTVSANFIDLEFAGGDGSEGNPYLVSTWG